MPTVEIIRRATFSAAHRLHSSALDDAENLKIFGKCNNLKGHGHNYVLEVVVSGQIDPKTGMVINLVDLKAVIAEAVTDRMDHRNLNEDVAELKGINPTAENLAVVIWGLLAARLPRGILREVRVHETENNTAIYRGDQ